MMYKAFATITLVAAPIIVLVAQSLVPQPHKEAVAAAVQPTAPTSMPVVAPLPAPVVTEIAPDPSAFGQPMPQAGQPFLSPGNGFGGGNALDHPQPGSEGYVERITDG